MDDDKLLRDLGRLAEEEEADDDRDPRRETWDRLVRGELGAAEIAELEELAKTDADVKTKLAMFRPLDAAEKGAIVADLAAHVPPSAAEAPSRPPAKVVPIASWKPRAYALVTAFAVAAALLLVLRRSPSVEPLPPYLLEVSGAASSRAPSLAPAAPCVVRANAQGSFELLARTREGEAGRVKAMAYVVRSGGLFAWQGDVEVAPSGAIRILAARQNLAGASELRLFIQREGALSSGDAYAKIRDGAGAGPGWQVVSCAVSGPTLD